MSANRGRVSVVAAAIAFVAFQMHIASFQFQAQDPGVRDGDAAAGGPLDGLTTHQSEYFTAGQDDFEESNTSPTASGRG